MSQRLTEKQSAWRQADFLTELITGLVLVLWIIFSEINRLDPSFTVEVGLILFLIFMASIWYRDYTGKKFDFATHLADLQAKNQAQGLETFTREVQGASSRERASLEARQATLEAVTIMLQESIEDASTSSERRVIYQELVTRIGDMQRSLYADPFELRFRRRS